MTDHPPHTVDPITLADTIDAAYAASAAKPADHPDRVRIRAEHADRRELIEVCTYCSVSLIEWPDCDCLMAGGCTDTECDFGVCGCCCRCDVEEVVW